MNDKTFNRLLWGGLWGVIAAASPIIVASELATDTIHQTFISTYQQAVIAHADADSDGVVSKTEERARYNNILRENGIILHIDQTVQQSHMHRRRSLVHKYVHHYTTHVEDIPKRPNGTLPTMQELTAILEQYK